MEQMLEDVPTAEYNKWKLKRKHGDSGKMVEKFGRNAETYRRALKTGMATEDVKKDINTFYGI